MSKNDLVQAWDMNRAANELLLKSIPPAALGDRYGDRTRTVGAQFAHIHNVRMRWVGFAAREFAGGVAGFPRGAQPGKRELTRALAASAGVIERYLDACVEAGRVKSWKGPPATFLGYLIAHEAHHRGLAIVALRTGGHKVPQDVVYGIWDWGKTSRRKS